MKIKFFRYLCVGILSFSLLLSNLIVLAIPITEEQTQIDGSYNLATNTVSRAITQRLTADSKNITKTGFWLKKTSGAGGYPEVNITFAIWDSTTNTTLQSEVWGNSLALTTDWVFYEIEFDTPIIINGDVKIGAYAPATTGTKGYVLIGVTASDIKASEYISYLESGVWTDNTAIDLAYVYTFDGEVVTPTVQTDNVTAIELNIDFPWNFNATLNGQIIDNGYENCTASFYYREKDTVDWYYANAIGTYGTGESFNATLTTLDAGTWYEYFARASNTADYDDGATVEFYTSAGVAIPIVLTLNYPIILNTENVTIYGQIADDGSSNCTGWFDYRVKNTEDWAFSTNATATVNLTSSMIYHQFIDGLTENVTYEFRAVASNDIGTGYGGIGEMYLASVIGTPTMVTVGSSLVTDTTAYVTGQVSTHNGSNTWVYFQYRKSGVSTWSESASYLIAENNTSEFSRQLTGLLPNTSYEYRVVGFNTALTSPPTFYYGYGEVKTFGTYAEQRIPVMRTDNVTWLDIVTVRVSGTVVYDGGSPVTGYFEYRKDGALAWSTTNSSYPILTNYILESYLFNLEDGEDYEYRFVGFNSIGYGYGLTEHFLMTEDLTPAAPDTIDSFNDLIDQLLITLHLTGTMGIWAFLFLLEILTAIIFGAVWVSVKEGKKVIGFIWAMLSMIILGAFVFTGKLGIWFILILVGAVVMFVLWIVSVIFSGGGTDG